MGALYVCMCVCTSVCLCAHVWVHLWVCVQVVFVSFSVLFFSCYISLSPLHLLVFLSLSAKIVKYLRTCISGNAFFHSHSLFIKLLENISYFKLSVWLSYEERNIRVMGKGSIPAEPSSSLRKTQPDVVGLAEWTQLPQVRRGAWNLLAFRDLPSDEPFTFVP